MTNIKNYIIFTVTIIGVALISAGITKCSMDRDISNLATAYSDTIQQERNDKGQLVSKVSVLETGNLELLTMLGEKDSHVRDLTIVIDEYSGKNKRLNAALVIYNQTIAQYKDSLSNNQIVDTLIIGDSIFYTYQKDFQLTNIYDKTDSTIWIRGRVLLGKKDFDIALGITNEYNVVIGRERKNIFSKWKPYAELTNKNPFDLTEDIKVYQKGKIKRKNWVVVGGVGYGFTNEGLSPVISISIGYKLIEF